MRSSFLAAALIAACGTGVNDLGLESAPLLVLRGRVDLAAVNARSGGLPLVASLVWADLVHPDVFCLKWKNVPEVAARCPDPYRFAAGAIETYTPLAADGDGTFELTVRRLPGADVSVGDERGRVAYGSLVVGVDFNTAFPEQTKEFPSSVLPPPRVIAASFYSLRRPQERIVFREGAFDRGSYFYPAPGCADPPLGFSVLSLGNILAPVSCTAREVTEPMDVPVLPDDAASELACDRGPTFSFPADEQIRPGELDLARPETFSCLDHETLAVFPQDIPCAPLFVITLSGCFNQERPDCTSPDWDLRSNPPSWWPC